MTNDDAQIAQEVVSIQDPPVTTLPTVSGVDSSGDLHEPIVVDAASPMELDSANKNDARVSESEKSEKDDLIGSEENDVREIKSEGKIPTVDHNKSNVLFDQLGDELFMDTDCMPLNPLEYMPEGLRKQFDKCLSLSKEARLNRHSDASVLCSPAALENVNFSMNPPVKQDDTKEPVTHNKVLAATNTADQSIAISSKARVTKIQRLPLQHTSDMQEMEPEMIEIVNGSKSMAQAMVDAAIKAISSGNMAQQALGSIDNSIVPCIKHEEHTNGSLDHHSSKTAESMTNSFISPRESGKDKTEMPTEMITSCVATYLMIQMCSGKQYPPADVAQLMDRAVSELAPRCPENMPLYREIQKCMGWFKDQNSNHGSVRT